MPGARRVLGVRPAGASPERVGIATGIGGIGARATPEPTATPDSAVPTTEEELGAMIPTPDSSTPGRRIAGNDLPARSTREARTMMSSARAVRMRVLS